PFGELPGTPGCLPSGEMETRAARFPCGATTGAGGAGDADSAMNVAAFPFVTPDCAEPTSGAGSTSPVCARCATRGAPPAFNSNLGRAGAACGNIEGAISASFWSSVGRSGAGSVVSFTLRTSRGRSFESVSWLICRRGRAGAVICWNCTTLGRLGRIFGGSSGAADEDALGERAPGHFKFGAFACFEADGASGRFGGLSKKVESVADMVQRHFRFVDRRLRGRVRTGKPTGLRPATTKKDA